MPIRMMHPQHGWTHAYGNNEVARLRGLGWDIEAPAVVPAEPVAVEPVEPPKKKPGRPAKAK